MHAVQIINNIENSGSTLGIATLKTIIVITVVNSIIFLRVNFIITNLLFMGLYVELKLSNCL